MKPRNREINIFSLSMLDVIAGAMGAFLIIMVVLFPYYKKEVPALEAVIAGLQEALSDAQARAVVAQRQAEAAAAEARAAREQATSLARKAEAERQALERKLALVDLDLVFVMDITGSMADQIADLRVNLQGIVKVLRPLTGELRVGFVAYRDYEDSPVTVHFPLTPMVATGVDDLRTFIAALAAGGGGTSYAEAVDAGLRKAQSLAWRPDVRQILVLIGDAPSHAKDRAATYSQLTAWVEAGEHRMASAIYTGHEASGRRFFRELARQGHGAFVEDRGRMLESILLSVLQGRGRLR